MDYDTRLEIEKQRSYKVVKANEIIQKARYDLNISELKALAFIFSKIKPTDTKIEPYTFSIQEYCQVCGIDDRSGKNYNKAKQSLKALHDKSFWLMDENGHETLVGWLQTAKINKGNGKITVKLDDNLQQYVIGLFKNYTQYELLSTLPMKSSYSFRIYELLKSYAYAKEHTFEINELKKMLGATHYSNFKDFRRKVLEVATNEINLYTDLEVTWEPIHYGRKVEQVKFTILQRDTWGRYQNGQRAMSELDGQMNLSDFMSMETGNEESEVL